MSTATEDHCAGPLHIDVLSIMSQVVYGSVGNTITVPLLQRLGLAVAAVPTVVLSNTPHYPTIHGGAIPADWFAGYLDDLVARDALTRLRAVVVGYLGSHAQFDALLDWWERGQARPSQPLLIIDPVMGDHDHGVYVDPSLVRTYRERLAGRATGLTPNGFELAQLTGMPVDSIDEVVEAARSLLVGRTEWVAVTSAAPGGCAEDEMKIVVVTRSGVDVLVHPRLPLAPKGTGDLFTASIAAGLLSGHSIVEAAMQAYGEVLAALRRTQAAGCSELMLPTGPGRAGP